jgi:hypothetical protein
MTPLFDDPATPHTSFARALPAYATSSAASSRNRPSNTSSMKRSHHLRALAPRTAYRCSSIALHAGGCSNSHRSRAPSVRMCLRCCSSVCTTLIGARWQPGRSKPLPADAFTFAPPAARPPTRSTRRRCRQWLKSNVGCARCLTRSSPQEARIDTARPVPVHPQLSQKSNGRGAVALTWERSIRGFLSWNGGHARAASRDPRHGRARDRYLGARE